MTKKKTAAKKPATKPQGYSEGYNDGIRDACRMWHQFEDRERRLNEPPPYVQPSNSGDFRLRLLTNGDEWKVQISLFNDDALIEASRCRHLNNLGFLRKEYETLITMAPNRRWVILKHEGTPITFSSRDAAVDWVRREFGESGVRSLKTNAEFRPA